MAIHVENFVSVRKLYPRVTERASTRMAVANPANPQERDYRDLLSEANLNFFHREYSIALDNYQALRYKVLIQSHPEMPKVPGCHSVIDFKSIAVDPKRLLEASRRTYVKTSPGDPIIINLKDDRIIKAGEAAANPGFAKFSALGLDSKFVSKSDLSGLRDSARDLVANGQLDDALQVYTRAANLASDAGDAQIAAEILGESSVMRATYASGPQRPNQLKSALTDLSKAEELHASLGDTAALAVLKTNRANIEAEITGQPAATLPVASTLGSTSIHLGGQAVTLSSLLSPAAAAAPAATPVLVTSVVTAPAALIHPAVTLIQRPQTSKTFLLADQAAWKPATQVIADKAAAPVAVRQVGLFSSTGTKTFSLDSASFAPKVLTDLYTARINATSLDALDFYEVIDVNFVAYFVHLYFFVLPIAIGDSYLAMGLYQNAINEYQSVLAYPFLNLGIEAPYLWLKLANAYLQWGNTLFRREFPNDAKAKYEEIIKTDLTVPATSPLYQPAALAAMGPLATEVVKEIKGQPHAAVNPKVAEAIIQTHMRLQYILQGFNFLGLTDDYAPIFHFKYLQSLANYLADNAAQAEKTFISFRSSAETQKLERMQFQNAVDVNQVAVQIEQKRQEDADLEVKAATQTREYAQLRKTHADDTLTEWDTKGVDLTSMNAALAWASNAANDQDITYTNVQYDGTSHDYSGNVHDFFDTVGEKREWLNWDMQRSRLVRQQGEAGAEVGIAQTREQQAKVRQAIQQLSVVLAQKRLEGSKEVLEYSQDRLFNEDMWFQLAAQLQDLAAYYLDAAIYAAFVMERAYELEFDRRLNRIRLDYGIGYGAEGLLGGELLLRDITSFSLDYIQNAQKKNPVRVLVSLRDEFPSEFSQFIDAGILPFRTDLEIFDRRFPGSYRRKIKKVELFVEGLVPLEGAVGSLTNQGINSEWRQTSAGWQKVARVMPVERMLLSSYQFRRDVTVFQPSDEILGLFENFGPQCNWTLELRRSANNLDYSAINDIKVAFYFDADFDDSLVTHVKSFYSNDGGRSTVLSARFQFPDEYFRLDTDRRVAFSLDQSFFAYNYTGLQITAFGIRLLPKDNAGMAGLAVTVTRSSDTSSVSGITDVSGTLKGDATTMAPFAAWKNVSPLDTFTVALGAGVDSTKVSDIQVFFSYKFTYRADGVLAA